jgi:hypothetical protein
VIRTHQVASYVPNVRYEIRIRGHLGSRWAAWFDGMAITAHEDGTTVLSGPVADQAALHGLLARLRDIGIPLVSLAEVADDAPNPEGT